MGYYAYASYALVAGRWMGALIAKRAIPLGTKIAEYTGPLMTDKQVPLPVRALGEWRPLGRHTWGAADVVRSST